MPGSTVEVTIATTGAGVGGIVAAIRQLGRSRVLVGVPSDHALRTDDDPAEASHPVNNATLAYIHENGAPAANIPARPFLSPAVKDSQPGWSPYLVDATDAALAGDRAGVQKALMSAGQLAADAARKKIDEGPFVPLSARTLEGRLRRGRQGPRGLLLAAYFAQGGLHSQADVAILQGILGASAVKPLLDTGALSRSLTYVVENGKQV